MRVLCSDEKIAPYKPLVVAYIPKVKDAIKKQLFGIGKASGVTLD